ncbi:ABC transporter permease [Ligilactobacillus acidipiscis]|uniref:ABC transporter permease n=1 Tax=Ligilactobacillus acidipiscis TaxID=89059 RepID=UPI0038649E4D
MNDMIIVLKEQLKNLGMIFRVSKYEERATYQSHYLGVLWEVLNPIIQVGIYYVIFGLGFYGGRQVEGAPFIVWMMIGLSVWMFMNTTILGTSNSIYTKMYLISKMNFPVSVLPSVNIAGNLTSFFAMFGVSILVALTQHVFITIKWIQFIYFFICMIAFLFSLGIFSATMTVLIRDYHMILQSICRVLLYVSGVIWNIKDVNFPPTIQAILELNPIFYIIDGFRTSLLNGNWFWVDYKHTLFFWAITLFIFFIGAHLHLKFRARFVDLS